MQSGIRLRIRRLEAKKKPQPIIRSFRSQAEWDAFHAELQKMPESQRPGHMLLIRRFSGVSVTAISEGTSSIDVSL